MIRKIGSALALVLVALALYLTLWPVPIDPVVWQAPPQPGYAGPHAQNDRMAKLQHIALKGEEGPEHVVIGKDGKLYTTVASGRILRMNLDGSGQEVFAETGGRVLGFDFDAAGNLIGADAYLGLVSISPERKLTVLADRVEGDPIRYADAVVVAKNGKMYFSDASTRFGAKEWGGTFLASVYDISDHQPSGRIIEYDPAAKKARVIARGLMFANGIALSQDEQSLYVAETGSYRILKMPVAGSAAPQVLFDNLPGFPDNLMRGMDGRIWVGLVKPRNPKFDAMADKPFLRKLSFRLPRSMWPVPPAYGHVFAFTEDGKVVMDLQDPSGAYPETTSVTETSDRLFIQSLHAKTLAWMPKPSP